MIFYIPFFPWLVYEPSEYLPVQSFVKTCLKYIQLRLLEALRLMAPWFACAGKRKGQL